MPRYARKQSSSGVYHVMLRGNNLQQIFYDEDDYKYFLHCLLECKRIGKFKLYAYCLMGNHTHLLINAKNEPIDVSMKRLGVKFVYGYNQKYERFGHLFQDRFKSEPVETDRHFLAVLRYIHQNPVKARIVETPEAYMWSSYHEYVGERKIVDTALAMSMLDMEEFVQWNHEENNDVFLDIDNQCKHILSDQQAMALLLRSSNCDNITDFLRLPKNVIISTAENLYAAGASIRQISRLTGCSKSQVARWLHKA